MIKTRIAKRYARALFELAKEAGAVEKVGADLNAVAEAVEKSPALKSGLTAPITSREAKVGALGALVETLNSDALVVNFLKVLLGARKISLLSEVDAEYSAMADEISGRLRGEAIAPMALDEAALGKLSAALSKTLGKEVVLTSREDKALIGGVVARVGNLVFDASVKTQLERMKDSLVKG
ncbi:ATP synthase F1 subunit delta [bacterium]|nr:MAG: ATP synthase F1 subunit delta [bacterium]